MSELQSQSSSNFDAVLWYSASRSLRLRCTARLEWHEDGAEWEDKEMEAKGQKGGGRGRGELTSDLFFASWRVDLFCGETELAREGREILYTLILHWHSETIAALSAELYYSALMNGPLWRVISWEGSVLHCILHCATTVHSHYKLALMIQNSQLTRSLQNWHRSFPPMKRVTSFQSFWKSTVYKGKWRIKNQDDDIRIYNHTCYTYRVRFQCINEALHLAWDSSAWNERVNKCAKSFNITQGK